MNIRVSRGSLRISEFEHEPLELHNETCGLTLEVEHTPDGFLFCNDNGDPLVALFIDEYGNLRVRAKVQSLGDLQLDP
jgi:hypothetical protein